MSVIAEVVWVPSSDNPADALTKDSASPALKNWMRTNELPIIAKSRVERKGTTDMDCTSVLHGDSRRLGEIIVSD